MEAVHKMSKQQNQGRQLDDDNLIEIQCLVIVEGRLSWEKIWMTRWRLMMI